VGNLIKKYDFLSPSIFKDFFEDDIFNDKLFHRRTLPPVNVSEDREKYQIEVSVPGIEKENIKVSREKNMLTVSYEQENANEYKEKDYHRKEFQSNSFSRSFELPSDVDLEKISSKHHEGILTINLPKSEIMEKEDVVDININ
jgi:HSP20 family protein